MLPKITFNQLAVQTEKAVTAKAQLASSATVQAGSSSTTKRPEKMPIIPPRLTVPVNSAIQTDDKPSWYVVISPRETRGLVGPYSVLQLKQMFKVGEINDRTLVWREGEDDWQQLINQSLLRSQLINLPILPPRIGNYNAELAVFDPVVELPKKSLVDTAILLIENDPSRLCTHCGALATYQIPNHGEHIPDLFKCRDEVGTTDSASEILPGFFWVGNSNSSKHRSILTLGVTMLINISENLKSPPQQIPFFRCKEMPLQENARSFSAEEKMEVLGIFEQLYDWIELERLSPERNALSDLPAKPYRGPVDSFGFPIKSSNDKPFRRPQADEGATFPSRVLVWSNDGNNRGCAVAITYLIRHYGISLDRATEIVKLNRPTIRLSPAYQDLVETWSAKYSMGIYLCLDCKQVGSSGTFEEKEEHANQIQDQEPKDAYETAVTLLKAHLPKLIKDQKEKEILQPVNLYLTKIASSYFQTSAWSGLMDLDLSNRRLCDLTLGLVFQLLGGNGATKHLRSVNLRNNGASFLTMKCLLLAYFPKVTADPEFDDYIDDDYAIDLEENYPSLTYLDVSHNKLDDQAVRFLCFFVQQCNSLVTLNVFNNNIEDPPLSDIIACFTTPLHSFDAPSGRNKTDYYGNVDDDDDSVSLRSGTNQPGGASYNRSVTDLNIGKNQFGPYSSKALILMVKQNVVLTHLTLDLCHGLDPPGIKKFTHAIRLYNSTLHEISFDGMELSVKSVEHIARIHESKFSQITKMKLAHCGLKHLHIAALAKYLPIAPYLTYLDLSGNPFGDKGASFLAEIIEGKEVTRDTRCPPLNYLDISSCAIKAEGGEKIMVAISKRGRFKYVDLSYNAIGSDSVGFFDAISSSDIEELHVNYCDLKSTGACKVFHILSSYPAAETPEGKNRITPNIRSLGIAGNEISDSAAPDFVRLLKVNVTLEIIDIGFNNFTDGCAPLFKEGIKVVSSDSDNRKTNELHINLVGNKCDPYLLDMPGMARAKINYRNGIQPNREDGTLGGYAQIEGRARGKFLVQKQLDDQYRSMVPVKNINMIR